MFSVIIPTFNRAGIVAEALDSIKAQTYRPVEVVVVDDGSTDATAEVVTAWTRRNADGSALSLRYVYQDNAGPGAARNRGIAEVRGEYVQFLDSDDRLHPERLARLAEVFEETGAEFIQTGFERFCSECGEVFETHYGNPREDQFELALRGRLGANTLRCALRRSLVERSPRWDEEMTCFEDYKYVVGALARSEKSLALRDVLASARRGGNSCVSDRLRTREGRGFRIRCEEELATSICLRRNVDPEAVRQFASRLYGLAFRSAASGWPDLARRCGALADSLDVPLDAVGRRRRAVYRLGPWAARLYEAAASVKARLQGTTQSATHRCPRDGVKGRCALDLTRSHTSGFALSEVRCQ